MSDPAPAPAKGETTFRSFTDAQGANYAQNRFDYHPRLYQMILDYHVASGRGQLDTLLDAGCGPGTATRTMGSRFTHAIGIDPSAGMIGTARTMGGGSSRTSEPIRFEVSAAEDLGSDLDPAVADGSVDLITVATAAHWFDMPAFWAAAARVLRPGGSVAVWTSGRIRMDAKMSRHVEVQAAIERFEEGLEEYMVAGNRLTRDLYERLVLPWTMDEPVAAFDEGTFVRREWFTGSADAEPGDTFFAVGDQVLDLDALEKVMGTTSPVTKWRADHPNAVGTEGDPVKIMRREIEELLHEAGVEKGKEVLRGGVEGVLLMLKKKA